MAENLKSKIAEDQKSALKGGDAARLSALRMLAAAITGKEIELRKKDIGLSDDEVLGVISSEAKKRKDSIAEYKKGGREDLAKKEEVELKILQGYLPPELPDDELLRVVLAGIREAGAASETDFGKVMKIIMPTLKNKASGDRISETLKRELNKPA
ncbi:MAG: GatB/YqeY domain-containing protein [Candidatus Giovannonibacteria bacterium]|nr:MAG: GatB/YqeY domain-containing protein [Candidatus Giovannonibacteria bacterium]